MIFFATSLATSTVICHSAFPAAVLALPSILLMRTAPRLVRDAAAHLQNREDTTRYSATMQSDRAREISEILAFVQALSQRLDQSQNVPTIDLSDHLAIL